MQDTIEKPRQRDRSRTDAAKRQTQTLRAMRKAKQFQRAQAWA